MDYDTVERTRFAFYLTVSREWGRFRRLYNQPRCILHYISGKPQTFDNLHIVEFAPYIFEDQAPPDEKVFVEKFLKNINVLEILGSVVLPHFVLQLSKEKRDMYDNYQYTMTTAQDVIAPPAISSKVAYNRKVFMHELFSHLVVDKPHALGKQPLCKVYLYPSETELKDHTDIALLSFQNDGLRYFHRYFDVQPQQDVWLHDNDLDAYYLVGQSVQRAFICFCHPHLIARKSLHLAKSEAIHDLYSRYEPEGIPVLNFEAWRPEWASPPANEKYNLF